MVRSDIPIDLKWIEEETLPIRPIIDEFETTGQRTAASSFIKKSKQNIFVPIGLVATAACIVMGLVSMSRSDSRRQQQFMRGRILFQGFTFAMMATGIYLTTKEKDRHRRLREYEQQRQEQEQQHRT